MNEQLTQATASIIEMGVVGAILILAIAGIFLLIRFILVKQTKGIERLTEQITTANAHLHNIADNISEIKDDLEKIEDRLLDHERRLSVIEGVNSRP